MKFTSGIIAFVLTFGLSVSIIGLLFGFPATHTSHQVYQIRANTCVAKYKIGALLRKDDRFRDYRNHKIRNIEGYYDMSEAELYNNDVYYKTVSDYVIKSSSMNDSNLPEDFKYAWRKHMQAWQNQANFLTQVNDKSDTAVAESEYHQYSDNTMEINVTWMQVLRIAERYDVDIPADYYPMY